jgi:pimeloyl-ACP methyl ester carboxylesterase
LYDRIPDALRKEIYEWLSVNAKDERKPADSDEQFFYKTRKKALGPFKKRFWELDQATKSEIAAAYDAKFDPRTPILSPEEKKVFVETFTKTGFTGGINWYRNWTRNWRRAEGLDHTVRMPSLMIMAENDAVLPPSAADGMEKLVPDLEKYLVRDSGHWTQQEKPEEVSAKLIEWRKKRFG